MEIYKLGLVETKFAEIIWKNEPIPSGELVKLCAKELEWKKPTTYTTLKKLSERGIFQNKDGIVSSILSKEQYFSMQGEQLVEEAFSGSLPKFLAAFVSRKDLSTEEIEEIRAIIDKKSEE
ncbi:MAG: BlaI/MecI/CopY family transcriptional regulator [Eubacteriales bacterium]